MKLNLDTILCINLCFRVLLLHHLLTSNTSKVTRDAKPVKQDPLSKRVFLILINGLGRDFMRQNATPFLEEVVKTKGTFGVVSSEYFTTNLGGLATILSGRRTSGYICRDSILDYVDCKCWIGDLPLSIRLKCYMPTLKISKLPSSTHGCCLYIFNTYFDPVLVRTYAPRLEVIDDEIRLLSTVMDDNETSFIVTSARGSPVGDSLSLDTPVVAWGKGITHTPGVVFIKPNELTAVLCALLGINFPTGGVKVLPLHFIDLHEFYKNENTPQAIKKVLADHTINSSKPESDQLTTRPELGVPEKLSQRRIVSYCLLIALQLLWGVTLVSGTIQTTLSLGYNSKHLCLLLCVVCCTILKGFDGWVLMVTAELLLYVAFQNRQKVGLYVLTTAALFFGVSLIALVGNQLCVYIILPLIVLWPYTFRNLNPFVLYTRLISGLVLGFLPFRRVFGESPDAHPISYTSLLYLFNIYSIFFIFHRKVDKFVIINFFVAGINALNIHFQWVVIPLLHYVLTYFLLAHTTISFCFVFGTLLERFFKLYLILLVPVQLLSIKLECIAYFSFTFHAFTWVFLEYHTTHPTELSYRPGIFTLEGKNSDRAATPELRNLRLVVFFIFYCYLSYFAFGHHPDLHSYDLYVVPTFIFKHPQSVGFFLGGFKFFLSFFVVTISLITICGLRGKDSKPLIASALWLSDVVGCCFIVHSQFVSRVFPGAVFPVRFCYFIIQQFASICVVLSYFVGEWLLLGKGSSWLRGGFDVS